MRGLSAFTLAALLFIAFTACTRGPDTRDASHPPDSATPPRSKACSAIDTVRPAADARNVDIQFTDPGDGWIVHATGTGCGRSSGTCCRMR